MNHDMSRSAIENGPACDDCERFNADEPGDQCSECLGHGGVEDPREEWFECPACDGTGVAP